MFTLTDTHPVTGPRLDAFAFPDDLAVVAVGDVHGRTRHLAELLDGLAAVPTHGRTRVLVFLGDLVDRGPDSLGTLHLAASAGRDYGFDEVVYLPGNHELMMLDALDWMARPAHQGTTPVLRLTPGLGNWMLNGGNVTLAEAVPEWGSGAWAADAQAFAAALPLWHGQPLLDHLRTGPTHYRAGDALFVHAGLAPKRPVADLLAVDRRLHLTDPHHDAHWAWVRRPFLEWPFGWTEDGKAGKDHPAPGLLVVHGHTTPPEAKHAWLHDPARLAKGFLRMATNARVCLEGGPLVAGALFTSDGVRVAAADGLG